MMPPSLCSQSSNERHALHETHLAIATLGSSTTADTFILTSHEPSNSTCAVSPVADAADVIGSLPELRPSGGSSGQRMVWQCCNCGHGMMSVDIDHGCNNCQHERCHNCHTERLPNVRPGGSH